MKLSRGYPALFVLAAVGHCAPSDQSLGQPQIAEPPRAAAVDARNAGTAAPTPGGQYHAATSPTTTPTPEGSSPDHVDIDKNNTAADSGIKKGGGRGFKIGGGSRGKGSGSGASGAARMSPLGVTMALSAGCVVASLM
ncbi:hypothetical protein F5Y14DRAFT_267229 [Nemania sp. NC0429]|nr:hypothetical protein F5Y14DRAFT_267229 [Nemania sp. NC0429]